MAEQAEEKKKADQKKHLKRIHAREKGVARIRKDNLLSNEFMTVALQDNCAYKYAAFISLGR